jgi:hypothetical protein
VPWESEPKTKSCGTGLVRTPTTIGSSHNAGVDPNPRLEPTGLSFAACHERFCAGGSGASRWAAAEPTVAKRDRVWYSAVDELDAP